MFVSFALPLGGEFLAVKTKGPFIPWRPARGIRLVDIDSITPRDLTVCVAGAPLSS